jgi:hypothetical protein
MGVVVKKSKGGKGRPPSSRSAAKAPVEMPDGMWERISRKAYELWEERGRNDGTALRDWLDAEAAVWEEIRAARQ